MALKEFEMTQAATHQPLRSSLVEEIKSSRDVNVTKCYQCGKCSAGCPLAEEMDLPPSLVMRMLQTGDPQLEERVLRSHAIWLCLTCETCFTRCPMEIDIPIMMDFLRQRALRLGLANRRARRGIIAFHRAFLDSVRFTGRLFEVGMTVDYKARSQHLLQDLLVAPVMFLKGKLHLLPERIKARRQLKRIFSRTRQRRGEEAG